MNRRTGWPVRIFANRSLLKQFFLLWKSHSRPSLVAFFYYEKATKAQSNEKIKTYNLGHVYKPNMQHSLFKNNTCNSGHASSPAWWLVWLRGWKACIEHMEHIKFLCFRCGMGNETIRGKHCFGGMEVMELWFYFKILSYKIFKKI